MATNNSEKKINAKSRLYGLLGVILIAAAAIAVTLILQMFNVQKFLWLYQLLILIAAGVGIYFVIRKTLYEFVYTFSKDHFLIHQMVGSRDTVLFAVGYEDILDFGPLSSLKMPAERKKKLEKFYTAETNLDVYYLRYHDINKNCDGILTFKPSGAVIDALTEKIS